MRGVTSQPNTLGAIAAFTVLLAVMYFQVFTVRQRVARGRGNPHLGLLPCLQ